ncbi:MAG: hypothetical protein ACTS5I_10525 [Rhodanobacter sp.]
MSIVVVEKAQQSIVAALGGVLRNTGPAKSWLSGQRMRIGGNMLRR